MVSTPENDTNFGLLPEPKSRFGSFGVSMVVNATIGALLLLFAAAKVHEVKVEKYNSTTLVFPPPPQPKPYIPPPKVHIIPPPPKPVVEPPKIKVEPPKPVVEPPKVNVIRVEPKLPSVAPAPPKAVTPPPQPKVGLFESSKPTAVANNHAAPTPKTGGFGDPNGAHPNPNSTRQTIQAVGSFDAAPGANSGAGAARKGSVQGVAFGSGVAGGVAGGHDHGTVASAGFGSGVQGGTGRPGGTGQVAQSGFGGSGLGQAGPRAAAAPQQAQSTPIVVLSKPRATYTAEARQAHVEGDVALQVRFSADGRVEVLQVISGLGHGLDEQARAVAQGIRFKPATKDGHPVDEVTVIHVTFQLA